VGLYYGLLIGLQPDLLNAMLPPLGGAGRLLLPIVGAIIGALSAFPAALASSLVDHLAAHHLPRWPLLGRMVRVAVGFGLLSSLITGILIGPQTSLFIGLVFGPIVGSLGGVVMPLGQIVIREVFGWSWKRAGIGVLIGLGLGFIVGGIYQQVTGASAWLWFWLGLTPIGTAVLLGLRGSTIETRLRPNQGIRRSVRMAVLVGGVSAVLISLLVLLIGGLPGTPSAAPTYLTALALSLGMVSGMLFSLPYGGMAALQHLVMRWLLARQGALPFQLVSFLDDCADRTFLRRVGGGYIFTHRLLMEHFAAMTDEDIARLSTEIEAGRR
jgi:MFS family permease